MRALPRFLPTRRRLFLALAAVPAAVVPAFAQSSSIAQLEDNKAVVRRAINEVQRDGNFALFEQLYAADYVDHTPFPGYASDREGTRNIYVMLRTAFPDFRATIHQQVAEGDIVTTFKTYHGTHRGVLMDVAPTGRAISFDAMDMMRVRNGQITDHWGVSDAASLMRQLQAPR